MSITLTTEDQRLYGEALRAMLTLDASEPRGWERAVCRGLKALLRADRVGFFGSPAHPELSFSEDYDADVYEAYTAYYAERDPGRQRLVASGRPMFTRTLLFQAGLRPLVRSECYNDFFVPNGMEDSAGFSLPGEAPGDAPRGLLALHRAEFGSDDFARRAPALLGMLLEPFRHGFLIRQRLRHHLKSLERTVDALPQPAALYDLGGRLRHANNRLIEVLGRAPDPEPVQRVMAAAARECAAMSEPGAPAGAKGAGAVPDAIGGGGSTSGRPQATLLHSLLSDPLVLVLLPTRGTTLPSPREMRARFGLTPRQAEVARLLAQRKTNEEVAEAVSISTHTARRHTEAVLAKLGVRSRRDVAAALRGGVADRRDG